MQYRIIQIPKGNGKFREIAIPSHKDKALLRALLPELEKILNRLDRCKSNYAFQRNRNCAQNALQHIGYRYTLSMDLENFFDCVKTSHVERALPPELIQLCFIKGRAMQGLPTSPIISSIAFLPLDNEITKALSHLKSEIVYTRYADDLVFSFDDRRAAGRIQTIVRQIVSSGGFQVNEKKTLLQDAENGRRIITGIGLDDRGLHATRRTKKKLRAARHQNNRDSINGLLEWSKCKLPKV